MSFIPDPTIPPPLYAALIGSDENYSTEVKDYLRTHGRDTNLSVTSLNKPVQALVLMKRYPMDIPIRPLEDLWHSFMGQIVHWVLEKYASRSPEYFTEFRMGTNMDVKADNGKRHQVHIHGMLDLYHREEKKIQDWKLTSPSSMLYPKTAFEDQLNRLAYLMDANGFEVKELENIYLFPHLDKALMSRQPEYPKRHALTVPVKLKRYVETGTEIKNKTIQYLTDLDKRDRDLRPCTDEERWMRGSYFKGYVRKKGSKKGTVAEFRSTASYSEDTLDAMKAAQQAESIPDEDFKIVETKGEPKFCQYCPASRNCHQHQSYVKANQPWRFK